MCHTKTLKKKPSHEVIGSKSQISSVNSGHIRTKLSELTIKKGLVKKTDIEKATLKEADSGQKGEPQT